MGRGPFFFLDGVDAETITQRAVELHGYELVDFQIGGGRQRLVRVFIDKPAGITVDDCVSVSNQLSRIYAVEGVDYERLEVSSPGLDRPLKRLEDFVRFTGATATVTMRLPIEGQKRFVGTIVGADDQGRVRLECEAGELVFDLSEMDKARLKPDI